MRRSLVLRQQLNQSIQSEVKQRTNIHQQKIAALKTAMSRRLMMADAPAAPRPLVMLAHGDSWFDYPLDGNGISLDGGTDIIEHLQSMGNLNPVIQNISHYGDATTEEMSWPKQQRLIDSLGDPDNWMENGKPDAILFSGGGNDIAGNQFCIFLNYSNSGESGLDSGRFQEALGIAKASYQDLFLFRDRNAPDVPIFGHCYDFPIPNGKHPICAGPWLLPSLTFAGWTSAQGTEIVKNALTAFRDMLADLASKPENRFILVNTQGTLGPDDWANELHPYSSGFQKIAQKFVEALRSRFGPNSI